MNIKVAAFTVSEKSSNTCSTYMSTRVYHRNRTHYMDLWYNTKADLIHPPHNLCSKLPLQLRGMTLAKDDN